MKILFTTVMCQSRCLNRVISLFGSMNINSLQLFINLPALTHGINCFLLVLKRHSFFLQLKI
jgi:hypothetical protein